MEEGRSREGNGGSPLRDLWLLYEWKNVSQENPKDEVLLEYNGDRLCGLYEELP